MTAEILILAAGAASRMRGTDKLLQPVRGQPLIAHVSGVALATGHPVTVTLPPDRPLRHAALGGFAVRRAVVPDPGQGMAASLRAGLAALSPAPVLLLLADLPDLTTVDLLVILDAGQANPDLIFRATAEDGTPGHPVLFPAWVVPELSGITGDVGPREVLHRHKERLRMIPLPGLHATTDLDTPEAWAEWTARQV